VVHDLPPAIGGRADEVIVSDPRATPQPLTVFTFDAASLAACSLE